MSFRPRLTPDDLRDLPASRIIVFDGAMGTQLQAHNLTARDFGGRDLLDQLTADVLGVLGGHVEEFGLGDVEPHRFGVGGFFLRLGDVAMLAHLLKHIGATGAHTTRVGPGIDAVG